MNPETIQIPKLVDSSHFGKIPPNPPQQSNSGSHGSIQVPESIQVPGSTHNSTHNSTHRKSIKSKHSVLTPPQTTKGNSFKLNLIILILFFAFFTFFLINCKNGMFKDMRMDPVPYSLS
jgi:hypothetical protein